MHGRLRSVQPTYEPFGTVVKGMNIVDKIAAGGSDGNFGTGDGARLNPLKIESVSVTV